MRENRENELILIDGEYYSHAEIVAFIESNKMLTGRVERQDRFIRALKANNEQLTEERNELLDELQSIKSLGMYEFADKYCSTSELEEAGHALARSLGVGVRMTDEDIAIAKAENCYVPYTAEDF